MQLDHPDRVGALVLAATDAGLYLPARDAYFAEEEKLAEIRGAWERRLAGSFHPAAGKRMREEQPELYEMYVEIGSQNGKVSRRGWGEVDAGELGRLTFPTLIIAGEEDIICQTRRIRCVLRTQSRDATC